METSRNINSLPDNCNNLKTGSTKQRSRKITQAEMIKRNIESLQRRFCGIKKYEARAALTMTKNDLDKAILLMELSQIYKFDVQRYGQTEAHLCKIHISLLYSTEKSKASFRNVSLENYLYTGSHNVTSIDLTHCCNLTENSAVARPKKVGVVIHKCQGRYRVNLL